MARWNRGMGESSVVMIPTIGVQDLPYELRLQLRLTLHGLGNQSTMDDTSALRPGLLVMSKSVADAVHGVGGLIFDRARLGWQVTVLVPVSADARPVGILGAEVAEI